MDKPGAARESRRPAVTATGVPGTPVSEEERAYVTLLRTAYELEHEFAQFLKPHELSPTQYNALRILRGAGAEGLACSQVADRMLNRDSDITRLLDRLEKRGLVARERGKKDRRVICAKITPKGLAVLKTLDGTVSDHVQGRIKSLGNRLEDFQRMLEEIRSEPATE